MSLKKIVHGEGFFKRIQVFSLEILNECLFHGLLVGKFSYDRGYHLQTRNTGCPPTSLSCNYDIAVILLLNDYGLNDAILLDRSSKFIQSIFIEALTRLTDIG